MTKTEALKAMKARRGEQTLILFHNGNHFETYEQDAVIIAGIIDQTPEIIDSVLTIRIKEEDKKSVSNLLLDAGHALCISEMRDSEGKFVVNINQEENYDEEEQ